MLNPLMLFGLLGLGLPIVIHLINRRRMRPRLLATLKFLDQEDVANAFAPVPRDVLQLLLRLLLLALFILLMARLIGPSDRASDRAVALVLDNSMSMQREGPTGASLFDAAIEQAGRVIDGLREMDRAAVVLVGDRVFSDTGLIRDRTLLREAVDGAWVSSGGARSLLPAIRRAVAEVRDQPVPDRLVVVFSDLRREMLAGVEDDPDLRRELATDNVRLVLIGEPLPRADNIALERAVCNPRAVHVGGGGNLTAKIRNYADRESVFDLSLQAGGSQGESRQVTLGPGESVSVDLAHRFLNFTDVALAAAVSGSDPLSEDDTYRVPVRLRPGRQILMVAIAEHDASDGVKRGYSGADILSYAINPEATLGLRSGVHTAIRRITPAAFADMTLSSYAALIFYGVDALPEARSLQDLRSYVESGGGIWLIPDRAVMPMAFNKTFGDLTAGAQLGVLHESGEAVFAARGEAALGSPVLLPLVRGEWGDPDQIPISRYWSVQSLGGAQLALATREGDALAAVAEIGSGRVFIQLFDCDIRSSAYPRGTAFLPIVQTVLGRLTGGDELPVPDVMRAGATHDMQLPPAYREVGGEVTVTGTATYRFPVDADGWVRINGIHIAGRYEVSHPAMPGRTRILTVNPVTGQSDLTPSDDTDLARVFGEAGFARIPFGALGESYTSRQELSAWLLALVIVALAVEALSGAWFALRKKEEHA